MSFLKSSVEVETEIRRSYDSRSVTMATRASYSEENNLKWEKSNPKPTELPSGWMSAFSTSCFRPAAPVLLLSPRCFDVRRPVL